MPYFRLITWSFIIVCCFVVFSIALQTRSKSNKKSLPKGKTTGQALIGGPFTLIDQKGRIRQAREFKNKYLLVYFGYSYCPDICPTALYNMTEAIKKLGHKKSAVQPIFISVDPERDTPEHLKVYMENFDSQFIALTGRKEEVAAAKKAYRVYSNKVNPEKTNTTDYLIDHSSIVYFMAPGGRFITHFNHETPAEAMASVILANVH
jgi:protein SCO1/2